MAIFVLNKKKDKVNRSNLNSAAKLLRLTTIIFLITFNFAQLGYSMMTCVEEEMSCCCEGGMVPSTDAHGCCCEVREVPRSDAMKSNTQITSENLTCLYTISAVSSEFSNHSNYRLAAHEITTARLCDICIFNSNLRI